MSTKTIIRCIEIALVVGSFGLGASLAGNILGSDTPTVAKTHLSSKFLQEGSLQVAKGLELPKAQAVTLEKRQAITPAGAAR